MRVSSLVLASRHGAGVCTTPASTALIRSNRMATLPIGLIGCTGGGSLSSSNRRDCTRSRPPPRSPTAISTADRRTSPVTGQDTIFPASHASPQATNGAVAADAAFSQPSIRPTMAPPTDAGTDGTNAIFGHAVVIHQNTTSSRSPAQSATRRRSR
ncbi:hypothetical protein [Lentzea atacamensis]|uniref:hypothetical protein n=1 Tax=Lentzea atacamensis TaxID=531938 RepID=UPI0011BD7076|nr:hypothetical protein [Lentzea atacamensis]